MKVLVTGTAGFIGYHTAKALLLRGDDVVGFDSVNNYYDVNLKENRIKQLNKVVKTCQGSQFTFIRANLAVPNAINQIFADHEFDRVINLAAQAGVRHSLGFPQDYVESNITGFTNILEACRQNEVAHLTYASTSSVYGGNTKLPFKETHTVGHPLQFYAATKRANELMAHSYSHLFRLPTTGLRFFSVYGPWGRPDMALFLFTKKILAGEPINVFNHGNHSRDFTYVDDIVQAVLNSSDNIAAPNADWDSDNPDLDSSNAPFRIFNIGNNVPSNLIEYIEAIEEVVGKKAIKNYLPLQPGDVPYAHADATSLIEKVGYKPKTSVKEGIRLFIDWYRDYYDVL